MQSFMMPIYVSSMSTTSLALQPVYFTPTILYCSLLPNIYIFSCLHAFKELLLLRIPFVQPWQTRAHPLRLGSRNQFSFAVPMHFYYYPILQLFIVAISYKLPKDGHHVF